MEEFFSLKPSERHEGTTRAALLLGSRSPETRPDDLCSLREHWGSDGSLRHPDGAVVCVAVSGWAGRGSQCEGRGHLDVQGLAKDLFVTL